MNEEQLNELKERLARIERELKETLDYSITIRTDREMKKEVAAIWQKSLGEFFAYIKEKSKETGENLLAGFVFPGFFW